MNSYRPGIAVNLLLCVAGFVLGRALFFPGFVDPWVSSHSDLYRYFVFAQSEFDGSVWRAPRPLALCFLWMVGRVVDSPEWLWVILACLSVIFAAALVGLLERLFGVGFKPYAVVLYAAAIFALPTSWQIYQLDFGGMLSGLLCIAAIHAFLGARSRRWFYILAALLFWAALEAKPTFGVLLPFAAAAHALQQRSRESIAALATVIAISMFVVLKDKFLGSPFVSSEVGNIYQLRIDPIANTAAVVQYLKASVPLSLLPGLALAYACALSNASTRALAAWMPAAALAAIAPMGLIPNRAMDLYSWYISIFLFAPLLTLGVAAQRRSSLRRNLGTFAAVTLVCLGLWNVCWSLPGPCAWVRSIASYNANVMSSLRILRSAAPEIADGRLLVSGLRGSYHAFWNDNFIRKVSGVQDYVKLFRRSERPWNDMAGEDGEGKYPEEADMHTFDYFAIYNKDGSLKYLLSQSQLAAVPAWWRAAVVHGVGSIDSAGLTSSDLRIALGELQTEGETNAAEVIRSRVDAEGSAKIVAIHATDIVAVRDWGPRATKVGSPFNVQPDGRSAIWAGIDRLAPHPGNYVEFGGAKITEIAYHPTHITFAVPAEAFAVAGEKKVSFFDAGSGRSVEIGEFNVQPAE